MQLFMCHKCVMYRNTKGMNVMNYIKKTILPLTLACLIGFVALLSFEKQPDTDEISVPTQKEHHAEISL